MGILETEGEVITSLSNHTVLTRNVYMIHLDRRSLGKYVFIGSLEENKIRH